MKPSRGILVRSVSAVSEAGSKVVSGTMCLVARRKGHSRKPSTEQLVCDPKPAYLSTVSIVDYTSEAGRRHGGYFDGIDIDFGVPQVLEYEDVQQVDGDGEDTISDETDEDDMFEIISFPSTPTDLMQFEAYSNDLPTSPGGTTHKSRFGTLRRWRSTVRRTLLPKNVNDGNEGDGTSNGESSVDVSMECLPPLDEEPPQLARMSFMSDATTGSLNRYLSHRQISQRHIERALERKLGMSILAYEREGSWLINPDDDAKFVCPFPQCEAHYGSSMGHTGPHSCYRHRRSHVETVYED